MYQKDILRDYIKESELRVFNDKIKVRLSKELAIKYDQGIYNNYFKNMDKYFNMIGNLNIKYLGNANPILYIYIVPDDNYAELLKIPSIFDSGTGGGKPVPCYDLEGFNKALGISQNLCEKFSNIENISRVENEIHELSHIIHNQFFSKNSIISEGFAEALPLYALGLEEQFEEHRTALKNMKEEQIYTAQELLNSERNNTYGSEALLPDKSCSFRLSYISSYLFVRGCLEKISQTFNIKKEETIQHFLEIVKQSNSTNEWLIFDIADAINIPRDTLLNGKEMQKDILKKI